MAYGQNNNGNNNNNFNPWASFGAGVGDFIGNMFQKNPADAANPYYEQALKQLPQYFQPWQQAGQQALPQWMEQIQKLISNPGGFINDVGKNYKASPGYQWQLNQGEQAINNASAAGGMAGSQQHQQQAGQLATNLANQDYYNYLKEALGQFGLGFGGLHDVSQQGQQASIGLGEDIANVLNNQAQLQYAGQANQNQAQGGGIGSMLGGLFGLLGGLF